MSTWPIRRRASPSCRSSRSCTGGYSGNRLYRARLAWAGGAVAEAGTATWVLKRWLPDGHSERLYRAHGGTLADRNAWRRSFALALLACVLTQVPFAGSMIRHAIRPVVATFERQVEMMLPAVRSLGAP